MTNINYVIGDATHPIGEGNKIITHICNDKGGWGSGFVMAISKRWHQPEWQYRRWAGLENGTFKLGMIQLVSVESTIMVANMIAQEGFGEDGQPPIRYKSLEHCLQRLADEPLTFAASLHMPRIGCGLAGGSWDKIEPIINKIICARNIPVTVYDLPPRQ